MFDWENEKSSVEEVEFRGSFMDATVEISSIEEGHTHISRVTIPGIVIELQWKMKHVDNPFTMEMTIPTCVLSQLSRILETIVEKFESHDYKSFEEN